MNPIDYSPGPSSPQASAAASRSTVSRSSRLRALTALAALTFIIAGGAFAPGSARAAEQSPAGPAVVDTDGGQLKGIIGDGVTEFRGIPYAAPPTANLRWRAPQPAAKWTGARDASTFSPVCPQQPPSPNGQSEDCLYLNVTTPDGARSKGGPLPVIFFIHGGGFELGEGADYDATKLAKAGAVVVTINYRLGLLGFLAHPALADKPGGPAGNYGLMDQQAALRWVQANIAQFGGDAHNVTIDGQSAGGLSVLAQLASPSAKGLFQRAIIESGAFAPKQLSLATAEAAGQASATAVGCADQSADCLRQVPVATLVANQPLSVTPGIIDGAVLKQSVLGAIAKGQFNRVPIINGSNTEEERLFTGIGLSVTNGATSVLPAGGITAANYKATLASNFGVSSATAAAIAAQYPLSKYAQPALAFSAANSDANFSCPALAVDSAASLYVPTYAYDFNDNTAPERFIPSPPLPTTATHQSELQYLFDLPNALPATLNTDQEALATTMRAAWTKFAATGSPATAGQDWPKFDVLHQRVLSLQAPTSKVETNFSAQHHCLFWGGVALTNLR
ncbi:carboxylesterase/lipase family protein [Leifsonia flava]|uniref:Carboxylic ester hydrolase n=1 Tax=Orlajensenia leifsoniae TaxID=2561933 RepID=A0A4Y9R7Z2_9MICO|nr:carboxylesterase family protein [Leifsonia flava]TFW00179.1 carboxylesterase family protein [Leifsonia flava]